MIRPLCMAFLLASAPSSLIAQETANCHENGHGDCMGATDRSTCELFDCVWGPPPPTPSGYDSNGKSPTPTPPPPPPPSGRCLGSDICVRRYELDRSGCQSHSSLGCEWCTSDCDALAAMNPCDRWAVKNNCGDHKAVCEDMGTSFAKKSCQCVESDNDCVEDGSDGNSFQTKTHCPCTPDGKTDFPVEATVGGISGTCVLAWAYKVCSAARAKKTENRAEIRLQEIEANIGIRGHVSATSKDGVSGAALKAGAMNLKDALV